MTAQHRAALRALIVGDGETRIDSDDAADRILEAGWNTAPDDGRPIWVWNPGGAVAQRRADGSFWRWEVKRGNFRGWMWHPLPIPKPPALYPKEQSNG